MTQPENLIRRLLELERQVAYSLPAPAGMEEFALQPGCPPVLLSAPHGAIHFRKGKDKEEDAFTTGLARLVGELTGAPVFYAQYKSNTDPNYYRDVPYKRRLRELIDELGIRCVIDLHGAGPRREFGLALGTLHGESLDHLRPSVLAALAVHGFHDAGSGLDRLDLDKTFPASGGKDNETVTGFVWKQCGTRAVQIEINASLRILEPLPGGSGGTLRADPRQVERVIRALADMVTSLQNHLSG